jgi:hypothetical protein
MLSEVLGKTLGYVYLIVSSCHFFLPMLNLSLSTKGVECHQPRVGLKGVERQEAQRQKREIPASRRGLNLVRG